MPILHRRKLLWQPKSVRDPSGAAPAVATTWDPSRLTNGALSNSNRTVLHTGGGNSYLLIASIAPTVTNQKVHIEHLCVSRTGGNCGIGFTDDTSGTAFTSPGEFWLKTDGTLICPESPSHNFSFASGWTTGDRVTVEYDTQAGTAKFKINGGAFGATATVPAGGNYYAAAFMDASDGDGLTTNFATADFVDTPTSGYTQLSA